MQIEVEAIEEAVTDLSLRNQSCKFRGSLAPDVDGRSPTGMLRTPLPPVWCLEGVRGAGWWGVRQQQGGTLGQVAMRAMSSRSAGPWQGTGKAEPGDEGHAPRMDLGGGGAPRRRSAASQCFPLGLAQPR